MTEPSSQISKHNRGFFGLELFLAENFPLYIDPSPHVLLFDRFLRLLTFLLSTRGLLGW